MKALKILIVLAAVFVVSFNAAYWGFRLLGPELTVIREVTVLDHDGEAIRQDVLIRGSRIATIGKVTARPGIKEIDGSDLTLIPGLVCFSYDALASLTRPYQLELLQQGVTTVVVSDGEDPGKYQRYLVNPNYRVPRKPSAKPYLNLAPVLDYTGLLVAVSNTRGLKTADLHKEMRDYLEQGLEDGAFGLHFNIRDLPGATMAAAELEAAAELVKAKGGLLSATVAVDREEFFSQVELLLYLGAEKAVPVHFHDFLVPDPDSGGAVAEAITVVEETGCSVTADRLPWLIQGNTLLRTAAAARARFPEELVYIIPELAGIDSDRGARSTLPGSKTALALTSRGDQGRSTLSQQYAVVADLPAAAAGTLARQPYLFWTGPPAEWDPEKPGNGEVLFAPLVRGDGSWLSRSLGEVPLDEAVRKMALQPAQRLGLTNRGVIREGAVADLVLIDQELRVQSVWVNGKLVVKDGKATGAAAGKVLQRPGQ